MKRTLFIPSVIVCGLLLFTACSNENKSQDSEKNGQDSTSIAEPQVETITSMDFTNKMDNDNIFKSEHKDGKNMKITECLVFGYSFYGGKKAEIQCFAFDENEGIVSKREMLSEERGFYGIYNGKLLSKKENTFKCFNLTLKDPKDLQKLSLYDNSKESKTVLVSIPYDEWKNYKGGENAKYMFSDKINFTGTYHEYGNFGDCTIEKVEQSSTTSSKVSSEEKAEVKNSNEVEHLSETYYKVNDPDGYSNLRKSPNGEIIKKVYDTETFEVIGTEGKFKKVKLIDGSVGYLHESRVVEAR